MLLAFQLPPFAAPFGGNIMILKNPMVLETPVTGETPMTWETPTFVEIRMDAEIGSYQDDFDGEDWH
jgi:hypothetical protein